MNNTTTIDAGEFSVDVHWHYDEALHLVNAVVQCSTDSVCFEHDLELVPRVSRSIEFRGRLIKLSFVDVREAYKLYIAVPVEGVGVERQTLSVWPR